jgi:parallel beta-helix repeat protein
MTKAIIWLALALLLFQCHEKESITPQTNTKVNLSPVGTILTANSTNSFNVSVNGSDAGDGSAGKPWRTLRHAASKVPANQGFTIFLSAGTFVENGLVKVPLGVSVVGAGIDKTILKAASSHYYNPSYPEYAREKFLIILTHQNQLNGNQTLSGFTIDGDGKKLHGGIFVHNRNNVIIENVKVQNTNFTGIWLWNVKDAKVRNSEIINSSWGSASYCSGALNLGSIENVEIDRLKIDEGRGYGIKAIGPTPGNNIKNLKIHDSRVSVHPYGLWKNGHAPNIAIELWDVIMVGSEIYNTYVDNTISLVTHRTTASTGIQTIRVHHNRLDMITRAKGAGYGVELCIHDAEVDNNYFLGGQYGIANWDHVVKNWSIHHNTFFALENHYPGDIVRSQTSGLHNVKVYNNVVEFTGTRTMNVVGLYGGASNNVDISNNLFINNNTGYSYYPNKFINLENGARVSALAVKNNSFSRLPIGTVPGTYQGNLTSDPMIAKTGDRPFQYYTPKLGSPLINAGLHLGYNFHGSGPDIGVVEWGLWLNNLWF